MSPPQKSSIVKKVFQRQDDSITEPTKRIKLVANSKSKNSDPAGSEYAE